MIPKIFIDTDLGNDCDDAGALAIAARSHAKGECEIIGISHCTSSPYGPRAAMAVNRFYGGPSLPIGVFEGKGFYYDPRHPGYDKKLSEAFPVDISPEAAPSYFRRVLSQQEDHSVTFVTIGPLNNLGAFLQSKGDGFSRLSGAELFNEKVCVWIAMAGSFAKDASPEFNLAADVPSSLLALREIRVKTVFSPFALGNEVITGERARPGSPVWLAYRLFNPKEGSRMSWDPITLDYAVHGLQKYYQEIGPGRIRLDEKGDSSFAKESGGNCYLLERACPVEELKEHIDSFWEE